jgi:hypothetical protein
MINISSGLLAAAQATQIVGETFPSERVPGATVLIQRRAHGVVRLRRCTTLVIRSLSSLDSCHSALEFSS